MDVTPVPPTDFWRIYSFIWQEVRERYTELSLSAFGVYVNFPQSAGIHVTLQRGEAMASLVIDVEDLQDMTYADEKHAIRSHVGTLARRLEVVV